MTTVGFEESVGSFVSFALAMRPHVQIEDEQTERSVTFSFNKENVLPAASNRSIDTLLEKYAKVKEYLVDSDLLVSSNLDNAKPQVTFESNVNYQIISIDEKQIRLAGEIAQRLIKVDAARSLGSEIDAVREFDDLEQFLTGERTSLMGKFAQVPEIDDVIGSHAIGRNANPSVRGGHEIIFVMIKIFLM